MSIIQELNQFITLIKPQNDAFGYNNLEALLQQLEDLSVQNSHGFTNYLNLYLSIISKYMAEIDRQERKRLLQNACQCIQLNSNIFKKHMNCIDKFLDIVLQIMIDVPFDLQQTWFSPPIGHNADDIDQLDQIDVSGAVCQVFRNYIDRVSSAVGYQKMINQFGNKLINLFNSHNDDWRWQTAILMIISQISQVNQLCKIHLFVKLAITASQNAHPKVRFAAAHVIGQFSDDLKPDFQKKYHQELLPLLIKKLQDPIQRVSSHWIAAMTNFVEDWIQPAVLEPYLDTILNTLKNRINDGNSVTKENAVSCIASFGTVVSLFNQSSINQIFSICYDLIAKYSKQKEYQQLINQTFECLTILIGSQPYPLVRNQIDVTVQLLHQFSKTIQRQYFLSCWSRICLLKKRFIGWEEVYPQVLNIAMNFMQDPDMINQHNTAIQAIQSTIQCFEKQFRPFAKDTFERFQALFDSISSQEEQDQKKAQSAFKVLCQLLISLKPAGPDQQWRHLTKKQIGYLTKKIQIIQKIKQVSILEQVYSSFYQLLKSYSDMMSIQQLSNLFMKFLNSQKNLQTQRNTLCEQVMTLSTNLPKKKAKKTYSANINQDFDSYMEPQNQNNDQNEQEIDIELKQNSIKQINETILVIPNIFQEIMNPLKASLSNLQQAIQNLLSHTSQVITNTQEILASSGIDQKFRSYLDIDIRYGIYIVDNIIQDNDYSLLSNYWDSFHILLTKYNQHQSSTIRNCACFGLSLITQKTPIEMVTLELLKKWLNTFQKCFSAPISNDKPKQYTHCQDNCVAAIGKILERYTDKFGGQLNYLYNGWLSYLPLKKDRQQNQGQIYILINLIHAHSELIIKDAPDFCRVIKIFAKVIKESVKKLNKQNNRKLLRSIKQEIEYLKYSQIFKQNYQTINNQLSPNQKLFLQNLLTTDNYTYE